MPETLRSWVVERTWIVEATTATEAVEATMGGKLLPEAVRAYQGPPRPWSEPEPRCPGCGATTEEHARIQGVVNEMREELGLPPLDPPDIHTGHQRRSGPS